ncbi:hypothetical protein M0804_002531 [Polistes exclamans]|nr:hypothetical protein M0804_002531 [Polistes exclamans]
MRLLEWLVGWLFTVTFSTSSSRKAREKVCQAHCWMSGRNTGGRKGAGENVMEKEEKEIESPIERRDRIIELTVEVEREADVSGTKSPSDISFRTSSSKRLGGELLGGCGSGGNSISISSSSSSSSSGGSGTTAVTKLSLLN